jgi:N-acetylglucosaminyl-diphospho-decaprenol L-rhamnosyltransferase
VSINPSVWIIIVNYRTADLVVNCLRSLVEEFDSLSGARVLVMDNASGDDSVITLKAAIVREGWQKWVSVVALERNGGFAFGNNAGIRMALASPLGCDYLFC